MDGKKQPRNVKAMLIFLSQAPGFHQIHLRAGSFHLVRTAVLRAHHHHLGELLRRENPELGEQHEVQLAASPLHNDFHFLGGRGGARAGTVHQSFWCFLFKHSRPRFPRHHGNLRSLSRQPRQVLLDYVEGHRVGDFRDGRTHIRHLLVAA